MKSYLCYIHSAGVLTPELRTIAAPDEESLPDRIMADMTAWPTLSHIELIEVCTEANELLFSIDPREAHPHQGC